MSFSDYALIDVPRPPQPKDHADLEVRDAVNKVRAREHEEAMADKYGASGIEAAEAWDHRVEQLGPRAAYEAQSAYENNPRQSTSAPPEPDRNEDDITRDARAAFREVSQRQSPADRERALAGIARFKQKYGDAELGVVRE